MDSSIKTNTTFSESVRTLAKATDKKDAGATGQQVSELAHHKKTEKTQQSISVSNKKQLNASIIESTLKLNTTIADQPLSLVLKTALQGINETLKTEGIENSIEETYQSDIDFSPSATAERIVSLSTRFLGSYREQHPEMGEEESLTAFADIIGQGITQGFSEARDVLGGLNVLEGEVADNIDTTYQLVQDGLQSFVSDTLGRNDQGE